jgi:hypothetical protein
VPLAPGVPLKLPVGVGDSEGHAVAVGVGEPQWEAEPEGVGAAEPVGAPLADALPVALPHTVPLGVVLMDSVGRPLALGAPLPLPPACVPLTVTVAEVHAVADGGGVREPPPVLVPREGVGVKEAAADVEGGAVAVPQAVAQAVELAQAVAGALLDGFNEALEGADAEEVPQLD